MTMNNPTTVLEMNEATNCFSVHTTFSLSLSMLDEADRKLQKKEFPSKIDTSNDVMLERASKKGEVEHDILLIEKSTSAVKFTDVHNRKLSNVLLPMVGNIPSMWFRDIVALYKKVDSKKLSGKAPSMWLESIRIDSRCGMLSSRSEGREPWNPHPTKWRYCNSGKDDQIHDGKWDSWKVVMTHKSSLDLQFDPTPSMIRNTSWDAWHMLNNEYDAIGGDVDDDDEANEEL